MAIKAAVSQKELEAAVAKGAEAEALNVPLYFVSNIQMAVPGNLFNLVFSAPRPVNVQGTPAVAGMPVVAMNMSPQTAKDLMLLLQDQVGIYEAKYGVVNTDFSMKKSTPEKLPAARSRKSKLNG